MTQYVFKMPDLGEGTVSAEVLKWYVGPGDAVEEDQLIAGS
jgi:pyruvate/2-oxoglutarate dehydrogenase complex dihydrolipoamide acyltransferase (E2) component